MIAHRAITVTIDGSNLRAGGGVTHLCELLRAATPEAAGVERVRVWAGRRVLEQLPDRPWLEPCADPALDGPLPRRVYWQNVSLARRASGSDLLFVPGGTYLGRFRPFVTMSRTLLPFQASERRRYGSLSWMHTKLMLLREVQWRTMVRANGVIFLTDYARTEVMRVVDLRLSRAAVISHGVDPRFTREPRPQEPLSAYGKDRPFRLLYVSTIDLYKHQWHVAAAVALLRQRGLPVTIDFVGASYAPALRRLERTMRAVDAEGTSCRYLGPVPYADLPALYHQYDAFVFASTCETMSNVMLEAMAAGLPVACSDYGLTRTLFGDGGAYFDAEDPASIAQVVGALVEEPRQREPAAWFAFKRAADFSWRACARETFAFLRDVFDER